MFSPLSMTSCKSVSATSALSMCNEFAPMPLANSGKSSLAISASMMRAPCSLWTCPAMADFPDAGNPIT